MQYLSPKSARQGICNQDNIWAYQGLDDPGMVIREYWTTTNRTIRRQSGRHRSRPRFYGADDQPAPASAGSL